MEQTTEYLESRYIRSLLRLSKENLKEDNLNGQRISTFTTVTIYLNHSWNLAAGGGYKWEPNAV